MQRQDRDPLLRGTRLLLVLAVAIFTVAGIGAVMALLPVWFFGDHVRAWLTAHAESGPIGGDALAAVSVILIGLAVADGLTIQFLRKLIAIIDSVGEGSPFIPENAARLRAMGWLSVALQVWAVLTIPITGWMRQALGSHHFFIPFSLAGLVTALLLFILARVFEHGTRLAEDIEGTV